jgi:hypothetical protein
MVLTFLVIENLKFRFNVIFLYLLLRGEKGQSGHVFP